VRAKLGGKCKRCGFSDKRALQFDHIEGIGSKRPTGWAYFKDIQEGARAGKIQLLCANCNQIKRHEVGARELGGKITWRDREQTEQRFTLMLAKLVEAGFIAPKNRRNAKRCTSNTIAPIAQSVLKIVGFGLTGAEMAFALRSFGWDFGSGKKSYAMGSMICRTAMVRRPDIFTLQDHRFDLVPGARDLLSDQVTCLKCGHKWIPNKLPPRSCASCKRDWRKRDPRKPWKRVSRVLPPLELREGKAAGDYIKF
jgi:hypothetical protein